jgi:hypothetical protein
MSTSSSSHHDSFFNDDDDGDDNVYYHCDNKKKDGSTTTAAAAAAAPRPPPSTLLISSPALKALLLFSVGYMVYNLSSLTNIQTSSNDNHWKQQILIDIPYTTLYQASKTKQFTLGQWESIDDTSKIPIFYNLYCNNDGDIPRVLQIVEEQLSRRIPEVHTPVFVNSIGSLVPVEGAKLLNHYQDATEIVTLKALYDYCLHAPDDKKVIYLHSKGSFTDNKGNSKLRRFLTAGALSRECASISPDMCDVCSSRFSPVPHPHTSGNMWLARCSYIKTLIDPMEFVDAMERVGTNYTGGKDYWPCDGRQRYAAEHWVHSHPSAKACDLYTQRTFVWNYEGVPRVSKFLKNIELARAPRFDLQAYIIHRVCPGRGVTLQPRLREYSILYNQTPSRDWWGWNYLQEHDAWWPYRELGWAFIREDIRRILSELGYSQHMWDNSRRPYIFYGKRWKELRTGHQNLLQSIIGYDRGVWDGETLKEQRDMARVATAVAAKQPDVSFARCQQDPNKRNPFPWLDRTDTDRDKTLREYVYEAPPETQTKKRVLIIAAVPRERTHLVSLWSELECFTGTITHVIISAPDWGDVYIERVVQLAKKYIPKFANGQVTIEARYYLNNRYDVGLWCDAIQQLPLGSYDEYALINDSVFALREFTGILDNLERQKVQMTSLSYSYTAKWFKGYGPEEHWMESIFRGFDNDGIKIFRDHSCVAEDHPFFCPEQQNNKACIINNFEHDLAKQYPCGKYYPSI